MISKKVKITTCEYRLQQSEVLFSTEWSILTNAIGAVFVIHISIHIIVAAVTVAAAVKVVAAAAVVVVVVVVVLVVEVVVYICSELQQIQYALST